MPASPVPLAGQVALVTGGGRGIGQLLAYALADAGAAVGLVGRTPEPLAATAQRIVDGGGRAASALADVTDRAGVEHAVKEIVHALGPIDLLVNNAGVNGPVGPFWEEDPDAWWRAVEINLRGVAVTCRAVLPAMIERGSGRVVNLVSHAGVYRWPNVSSYSVAKSAVIKLTENLAVEARRHGVQVFAVHPGMTPIGLTAWAVELEAAEGTPLRSMVDWIRREGAAGRWVPAERSAALVVQLATGRADALTGRYLRADQDLAAVLAATDDIVRGDKLYLRLAT